MGIRRKSIRAEQLLPWHVAWGLAWLEDETAACPWIAADTKEEWTSQIRSCVDLKAVRSVQTSCGAQLRCACVELGFRYPLVRMAMNGLLDSACQTQWVQRALGAADEHDIGLLTERFQRMMQQLASQGFIASRTTPGRRAMTNLRLYPNRGAEENKEKASKA